ncbi:protein FD-like [Durio zibethinus]|uniref:Protein FD-like n=1 Tax=Durio zibethinus TaxID=66656 RepID=A0A6P5YKW8_DURZI|nr:protein FD-like [Durio zibethinus]
MLSSSGGEDTNNNKATISLNRVSSVSSKSSSTSSSPSADLHNQIHRSKTMEEVWKDINLASLHDHTSREGLSVNPNPHNPHFILQDFLARPFSKDPPTNRVSTIGEATLYGSPAPPPATVLSLNSGPAFDFLDNSGSLRSNSRLQSGPISNLSTFNCPFEGLASSSSLASFGKKKVQESDSSSGDRRHKRMIKNRESAARSRARKQAYTNELELEVAHLMEENARLKRQQEQLRVAAAAQLSKKRTLQRTSTAPF